MWKHKKLIIILLSIIFFLTALTFYANKVLFPTLIKKIAIEQAQNYLKRKVAIDAIRFNWVKGLIVDRAVIYQKDSPDKVFLQFERLSMGIIFIPGFKSHTLNIPFINIDHLSAHIMRMNETTWNFSDLLSPPENNKPSPFNISVGGININDGKVRLEDQARSPSLSEIFDDIDLHISLSFKGINFDFSTNIPRGNGFLSAKGIYVPIDQSVQASVRLKNIDMSSYIQLAPIKGLDLKTGMIKDVDVEVEVKKEKITLNGSLNLNQFDLTFNEYHITASLEAKNLDVMYANGPINIRGDFNSSLLGFKMPGITFNAPVGISVLVYDAKITPTDLMFDGTILSKSVFVRLSENQTFDGEINLEGLKARKDKEGIQIVGSFNAKNAQLQLDDQLAKVLSITFKPLTLTIDNANTISAIADIKAEQLSLMRPGQKFSSNLNIVDLKTTLDKNGSITLSTKGSAENYSLAIDEQINATGTLNATKLMAKLVDGHFKIDTSAEITKGKFILTGDKIIEVSPQFEIAADVLLKDINQTTYKGSITFSDGKIQGFPYTPLDGLGLDATFNNDNATINALTVNALDSSLRASGTLTNFNKPNLAMDAEASNINLSLIKNYFPEIFKTNELSVDGSASLKVKFNGLLNDPLNADIKALATLARINVIAGKANQSVKNISGIVEATSNSLVWRDFKGTYLDKTYTLTGKLNDFKNPSASTSLDGEDVSLKAEISKDGDLVTLKKLEGKYLTIGFDVGGSIALPADSQPILDIKTKNTFLIEDIIKMLPQEQQHLIIPFAPQGAMTLNASIKGLASDWKNWTLNATLESPLFSVVGYKINNLILLAKQNPGTLTQITADAAIYDGTVHAVGSVNLLDDGFPFDLALNLDSVDLKKLKMDSPMSAENIKGKLYLTSIAKGKATDAINVTAKGSLAIREGFLGEFKIFKGLLSILNEALRLGQVMITDVEGNFIIDKQKISTESLRLKSPTIVLLTQGWVSFDQMCDLKVVVDLSSGIIPTIAEDVLRSLEVRIYDKITNPKFSKKISMPQVLNTIIKTIGIFQ